MLAKFVRFLEALAQGIKIFLELNVEEKKIDSEIPEVHAATFGEDHHYAVIHFKGELFGIYSPTLPQLLYEINEACSKRMEL